MAERKSILLRMRPELYDALQRWAQDEFRSVNGQVEYLLDQAVLERFHGVSADHFVIGVAGRERR